MTTKNKPAVETVKIKGIKARTAAAVEQYLSTLKAELNGASLLEVIQNRVRLAVPEAYKQLSMNKPIRRELQELGLVKPGEITINILNPTTVSAPDDIQSFVEGRYNTTVVKINNDLKIDGYNISSGDVLRVSRIERVKKLIHFTSLISKNKYSLSTDSVAFSKTMKKANFYYESEMPFSEGDIVSQLAEPNHLYQVTSISKVTNIPDDSSANQRKETKTSLRLTDISGNTLDVDTDSVEGRSLSLAYASSGEQAIGFNTETTIVLIDGDDKSKTVKAFLKAMFSQTASNVFVFGVEKTLRKSVQVVCPSEMMELVESVVVKLEVTHRKYVETLIDDFLSVMDSEQTEENTFMVLYSSPPLSKANPFWISETHYERLKIFCDENGFKVNPLAHHLIFSDLVRRNLVVLDDRFIPSPSNMSD